MVAMRIQDLAWLSEHNTTENQELRASKYNFAWFFLHGFEGSKKPCDANPLVGRPEWRIWRGFQSIKPPKIKNCALQNTILHGFEGSNSHVNLIIRLGS